MSRLPKLTGEDVVRALSRGGFEVMRQRGSHLFLKHSDGNQRSFQFIVARSWDQGSCLRYFGTLSLVETIFANCSRDEKAAKLFNWAYEEILKQRGEKK